MTKKEEKAFEMSRRKHAREINIEIYRSLCRHIVGPRFPKVKYQIGDLRKETDALKIIVSGGYGNGYLVLYFDYRIRISAVFGAEGWNGQDFSGLYDFAVPEDWDGLNFGDPEICSVIDFLKQFLIFAVTLRSRQAYESMGSWPSDKSVERWFRNHGVWRLPAPRNQFAAAFRDRNGAF